jgi:putative spermidine/putrescine transport system permease protein
VNRTPRLLLAFHWLFAAFMLAPLVMVALVSFTDKGYIAMPFDGASWRWYLAILKNDDTDACLLGLLPGLQDRAL